jgi:hypothetical protein
MNNRNNLEGFSEEKDPNDYTSEDYERVIDGSKRRPRHPLSQSARLKYESGEPDEDPNGWKEEDFAL